MRVAPGILVMLLLCFDHSILHAGGTIQGLIRDGKTGERLPAANIQIKGTWRGTITNDDGEFELFLEELPATLIISYIGYQTRSIQIREMPQKMLIISMKPIAYEMEEIVVTGEDPAIRIMEKVIHNKQKWRKKLHTYRAEAYTRQVLENDTGIVSITESISEAFWHSKKGSREVIKAKRQTSNLPSKRNYAGVSYVPNFYDDDIEIQGFRVIGPTHPEALHYYDFKLTGQRQIDEKIVYDIEVIPKNKLQPTFEGRLAVLDEEFALLEVVLKPGESLLYPPPIRRWDVSYTQQFRNFGQEFWLPIDVRIQGDIKIAFIGFQFPLIRYSQISRLTNYQVNVEIPDSLYEYEVLLQVDSLSIKSQDLFATHSEVIPLSQREARAYQSIDSTLTLARAFKPSGSLARFVKISGDDSKSGNEATPQSPAFQPEMWFNRVDALHLGLRIKQSLNQYFTISIKSGYNTGPQRWNIDTRLFIHPVKNRITEILLKYYRETSPRYIFPGYSLFLNGVNTLLSGEDYYDYFWKNGWSASFTHHFPHLRAGLSFEFRSEEQGSMTKSTDYVLFDRNKIRRENPAITDGSLRSLILRADIGDEPTPFGIVGNNRLAFLIEHTDPGIFSSDFSYTHFALQLEGRIATWFRWRMLPNALNLRLVFGITSGRLPAQRLGALQGPIGLFHPFGVIKTLTGKPYEGDKYLALFWEHDFRTIPFEVLGLRWFARKGIGMILHGASGRTWIFNKTRSALTFVPNYRDRFHHEIGLSINSFLGLLRIDFTWRLDQYDFVVGIAAARWF